MHILQLENLMVINRLGHISYVKSRKKNGIIVKFDSSIKITSYPLTPSWNKLHILMHNIVLHIFIYLFPWLHVLCDQIQYHNITGVYLIPNMNK